MARTRVFCCDSAEEKMTSNVKHKTTTSIFRASNRHHPYGAHLDDRALYCSYDIIHDDSIYCAYIALLNLGLQFVIFCMFSKAKKLCTV